MLENIQLSYPSWYLLLCLLLGLFLAGLMYWKDKKLAHVSSPIKWGLFLLRTLVSSIIAFLLLSPFIKTVSEEIQKPIIVFAQDMSGSLEVSGDAEDTEYQSARTSMLRSIQENYELVQLSFGDDIVANMVDTTLGKSTDISKVLGYIDDNYSDQNLGAVILATDGIFNEGVNPIYFNSRIKAPIHSIALGDSTTRRDVLIKNVFHNRIAYLGDEFSIQVDVQANNARGNNSTLTLYSIENDQRVRLSSKQLRIDSDKFFSTVEMKAKASRVGTKQFLLSLSGVSNEISVTNNSKNIYIEVIDNRQKILLLADSPHPDLSAFKQTLQTNKNYEIDIKYAADADVNPTQYDFILLHNLPSKEFDVNSILTTATQRAIPLLFVVGTQTDLGRFNSAQNVLSIRQSVASSNESQAYANTGFNSYTVSDAIPNAVKRFPPMIAPFGEYQNGLNTKTILYQTIKDVDTKYSMIAVSDQSNRRTGVIAAEGIWKWRLFDFMDDSNYETTDELISKLVQYLVLKEDKRKFRSYTNKNIYKENESIYLDAQLYNDNFELINGPEVYATISNAAGKKYDYTFSRNSNYYTLDAGRLPPGKYNYTARTTLNGKDLNSKGAFTVQTVELEQYDLTARHDILHLLGDKYGGKVYTPDQINTLAEEIKVSDKIKPVAYYTNHTKNILNLKWIFGLLACLLILEWFLRRYFGSY